MQAAATTFLRAGLVVPAGVALVVALHAIIAPASWRG
jgi:hypothetical protein